MKMLDVPQSGSLAGQTSSRNRYGQYRRTRATPVNPNSTFQGESRSRLAAAAADWRTLTDVQRAGWSSLGSQMSRTDSLGQAYTLNGFSAFISVNSSRAAAGDTQISNAPSLVTPAALDTATLTVTASAVTLAFTPTPLPAGQRLAVNLSPQVSAGRSYWSDFRQIAISSSAVTSPQQFITAYAARLGTPVVGNKVIGNVQRYEAGFLSVGFIVSDVVS